MRRSFTVTVEDENIIKFKEVCKKQGVQQSMLIDAFMRSYINGDIEVHLTLSNRNTVSIKEDKNK